MMKDVFRGKLQQHPGARVAIVTHVKQDGDALGSALGLACALRASGHSPTVVLPDSPPEYLRWMPGCADTVPYDVDPALCEAALRFADVVVVTDLSRLEQRTGGLEPVLRELVGLGVVSVVDHHRGAEQVFLDDPCCRIDVDASSASEMMYGIAIAAGLRVDRDAATCFYTGIMTDTGSFRFPSTSAATFRAAEDLVLSGASPAGCHAAVNERGTVGRLRLLGLALTKMDFMRVDGGHQHDCALVSLSPGELVGSAPGDAEGVVNYPLSVAGVRFSALLTSTSPDETRVSLRSKGALPVNDLAGQLFGGGGHANAAGGTHRGPVLAAERALREALPGFIAKHPRE